MPRFNPVKISAATEEAWGKLVKTWATGKSYFPSVAVDKLPVPRTLDDVRAQCRLVGVEITIPPAITGLAILQHGSETMALRLPPKKMVEDAEADLQQGVEYSLPNFYRTYCGRLSVPAGQETTFQACRIGDYSISQCN